MELNTAMEFSIWKEEPLSPVFSGLEDQTDVWELFKDDAVKQSFSPERDPLENLGNHGDWLPDSPGDSCDSLTINTHQARAQLASQLLQDLDEVLIKEEFHSSDWYEPKTGLSMFDELSPPSFYKEEALAGAAVRPFAGLSLNTAHFGPAPAAPIPVPVPSFTTPAFSPSAFATSTFATASFATPSPPAAVLVPLSVSVGQQQQQAAVPSLQSLLQPQPHHQHPVLTDTQTLLQEFECVFGEVEQSHCGTLTPPQSPPHRTQHQYPVGIVYQHQHPQQQHTTPLQLQALPAQDAFDGSLLTPDHHHHQHHQHHQQQQQHLIAEVDEIVRVHAEESWPAAASATAFEASFAPPSPCTSSNSSSSSFSSDSPAPASPETDDPDWLPAGSPGSPSPSSSSGGASPRAAPSSAAPGKAATAPRKRGASKRSKPYSHTVEDKRSRKKEQNKNAATRYRMKKKAEVEVILGEENELKDKNDELQAKVTDLSQEIRYLKNLMRDLFRARGLIK